MSNCVRDALAAIVAAEWLRIDDEYRNGTDEDARLPVLALAPGPTPPKGPADESETPMVKIAFPEGGGEAMQGTSGSGSAGAGRRRLHKHQECANASQLRR